MRSGDTGGRYHLRGRWGRHVLRCASVPLIGRWAESRMCLSDQQDSCKHTVTKFSSGFRWVSLGQGSWDAGVPVGVHGRGDRPKVCGGLAELPGGDSEYIPPGRKNSSFQAFLPLCCCRWLS